VRQADHSSKLKRPPQHSADDARAVGGAVHGEWDQRCGREIPSCRVSDRAKNQEGNVKCSGGSGDNLTLKIDGECAGGRPGAPLF